MKTVKLYAQALAADVIENRPTIQGRAATVDVFKSISREIRESELYSPEELIKRVAHLLALYCKEECPAIILDAEDDGHDIEEIINGAARIIVSQMEDQAATAANNSDNNGVTATHSAKIREALNLFYGSPRSAWAKGVRLYALELLDNYDELADYCQNNGAEVPAISEPVLLNGADSWAQYSAGGCSLVYDGDIAARLCTPSKLRRTNNGERNPNSSETWIDLQARALRLACKGIIYAAKHVRG